MLTKNLHMSFSDRQIIETGIYNGSSKKAIATTLGKDKSTIGKEIKLHRFLAYKCHLPLECSNYKHCKHERNCTLDCIDYVPFKCTRRDKSPGACNGCENYRSCRYDKYRYSAIDAQNDYKVTLTSSRAGINATVNDIRQLGELLLPLLRKGQSIYSILQGHPEIKLSEKTIYNYIENGVFQDAGISISAIDLKRVVRRKMTKDKRNAYKPHKDSRYLIARKYSDFLAYMDQHPDVKVVEMDTVYNDVSNGPFLQTFKFRQYDLLICIYQAVKDSLHMLDGILLLERILGKEMFAKEVEIILTDRGSEFILAEEAEMRENGTRRTRMFYCDSMASWQEGSLENVHLLVRELCPKGCDLYALGLTSQEKANLISSHINSYPKEKLHGRSSLQLIHFFNEEMAKKLCGFGITEIPPDEVILKPYLLK